MNLETNYSNRQSTDYHSQNIIRSNVTTNKSYFEIHTLNGLQENYLLKKDGKEKLNFYEITWLKSGRGDVDIDSNSFELKNNSIYCFVPGQLRSYRIKDDADGYSLSFSPDFLYIGTVNRQIASWLDSYGTYKNVPVMEADPDMQREMADIICKMQKEFTNYYLLRSEILSGLLNILLIYLSRKLQVNANDIYYSKETEMVRRFKSLLKEKFITKKLVADYASELCVTPNYLNRTVKKITGFTASHHIQQLIVMEAKRRAAHSNISMKEIAYFLGFDNLAHFSKFFKNNSGMNFTSFKKTIQPVID